MEEQLFQRPDAATATNSAAAATKTAAAAATAMTTSHNKEPETADDARGQWATSGERPSVSGGLLPSVKRIRSFE